MTHTQIKPGAYRQLFIDALLVYKQDAHPDEFPVIDHYLTLLRDPEYKFGKQTGGGGGYTDFFRS